MDKIVGRLRQRLRERRIEVNLVESAYEVLMNEGFSRELGAREMERTVERLLLQPLAKALLEGRLRDGSLLDISGQDKNLVLEIRS